MSLKEFIFRAFVKLDETKPQVSESDFKKVVGVSKNDFEKKLRNVSSHIKVDQVQKKSSDSIVFLSSRTDKFKPSKKSAFRFDINDIDAFDTDHIETQSEFFYPHTILHGIDAELINILERLDEESLDIYYQLLELRQVYRVLKNIDNELLDIQNNIFRSSPLKILEYNYLDLMSSLKDVEEINPSSFNFLHFSHLTSNYNVKTEFT